ncbi:MAG: WD40 repeat domain-containing protein [Bacteroidota bacterium]
MMNHSALPLDHLDIRGFQFTDTAKELTLFTTNALLYYAFDGEEKKVLKHPAVRKIIYTSAEDYFFLIQHGKPHLFLYDKNTLKKVATRKLHKKPVNDMALSHNQVLLASCDEGRMTYVQKVASGEVVFSYKFSNIRPFFPLQSVSFNYEDTQITISRGSEELRLPYNMKLGIFRDMGSSEMNYFIQKTANQSCELYLLPEGEQHTRIYLRPHNPLQEWLEKAEKIVKLSPKSVVNVKVEKEGFFLALYNIETSTTHLLNAAPLPLRAATIEDWQLWLQFSQKGDALAYFDIGTRICHIWEEK